MTKTSLTLIAAGLLVFALPAWAQDQLVPADAEGKLAEFAGQPWIEPLAYCTAVWTATTRLMPNELYRRRYTQEAVAFRHPAVLRVEADRQIDYARAQKVIQKRVDYHQFFFRAETDVSLLIAKGRECDPVLEAYRRAYP